MKRISRLVVGCATSLVVSSLIAATPQKPLILAANKASQSVSFKSPTEPPQVWNLKNADIRAVIQTMSILTGKNFIIDPQVQGRVTLVSHKPMSTDEMYQVFLSMLRMLNFSAVPMGGVTHIVPSENANILSRRIATKENPGVGGDIVVRIVPLNNVSATELVPVIRPLMSQAASVTAYMPSNALIIAGTASNINRMITLIEEMDESNINQIKIIHLHHANATKVVSVIRSLQSAGESQGRVSNLAMSADQSGNNILISANAANQMLVKHLIDQLDQKNSGGDDTRVVDLNYLTAKDLAPILTKVATGLDASSSDKSSGSSSKVSIQAEKNNNALIIHAPEGLMGSLLHVVKKLDVRPQQVLVEAIIVKVSESLLNQLGIVWGAAQTDGTITGAGSNSDGTPTAPDNSFQFKVGSKGVGFLPSGNIGMLLRLLKGNGGSDVLSTPSVVVLNNQKASIDDGQNIGVSNRSYQGNSTQTPATPQASTTPFNTITRQNVTLSLAVTPHISPNKMIRMELTQKDDSISSTSSSNPDNPTLNTSQIKTSVLVKSGDVLVLGGLINNEQDKQKEKLPILGDLPLVGKLFQYNSHKIDKKSLMVFIRPIVMSNHMAQTQTKRRYRFIRSEQINMAMNKPVDKTLPILPKLDRHGPVSLQPPVGQLALPSPVVTELPIRRHKRKK